MKQIIASTFIYFLLLFTTACSDKPKLTLEEKLNNLDGVEIIASKKIEGYSNSFYLSIEQPLDHQDTKKGKFQQRVYLLHRDDNLPMLIETNGYDLKPFSHATIDEHKQNATSQQESKTYPDSSEYLIELSDILNSNVLAIEYRFFGGSTHNDSVPWEHLSVEQAAADHHRIITLFKSIYQSHWVTTGYSKGGESALFHRRFYPNDAIATIAYDTPLILGTKDRRTDEFIKQKNKEAGVCGKEIIRFQREILQRRNELIPELANLAEEDNMEFSIGLDVVLEYSALEYTFSFWQRGQKCEDIPPAGAKPNQMIEHINDGQSYFLYSDAGIKKTEPSIYQHHKQMGYYGFITDDLKDLLEAVPEPDNRDFLPKGINVEFDPDFVPEIITWLQKNGNNIIYLYGENDTWYACAVDHGNKTNAFTLVAKNGHHGTKIRDLNTDQKNKFYNAIEQWLKIPINRI